MPVFLLAGDIADIPTVRACLNAIMPGNTHLSVDIEAVDGTAAEHPVYDDEGIGKFFKAVVIS